jgi:endonuclease G
VIRESFLLSNITPQHSRLNQHKWRLLEERIQNLARDRGELWVITGPVFVDGDNDGIVKHFVLGKNMVAIPTHYYKVVYSQTNGSGGDGPVVEAMAFLVPNTTFEGEFEDHLVSIDEIERLTALDLLPDLAEDVEVELEAHIAEEIWSTAG